jgi:hypothetical protein
LITQRETRKRNKEEGKDEDEKNEKGENYIHCQARKEICVHDVTV